MKNKLDETQGSQSKFHELNIYISNIYIYIYVGGAHAFGRLSVCFALVSLFNGISGFMGNLMPNHPCRKTVEVLTSSW